ncbi:chemotaxis protein CheB [Erythrobacter sp. T5W1-R]|uniref:chemotaxis protein CheB n=1 Tax=Erythrobacter sp. T5W1-R TaxID=3101752 RepID=UPI002AFF9B41|nr:chemotaxis protein CheB [Erythrobacter sp. T5W1-R]
MSQDSTPEAGKRKPAGAGSVPRKAGVRPATLSPHADTRSGLQCPIVAIGASAGGLEAMTQLLDVMPADTGMAFLLVQHLDPYHASQLAELLASHTRMPIREAAEGMAINPDEIYICPPGHFMSVRFGVLHLSRPQAGDHIRLPIDFLIRSLAEGYGARSVCVILSGNGEDGSAALAALHRSGGYIIVQDPKEAEHDGMPRSAIMTGLVNAVVPLSRIPPELARISVQIADAAAAVAMLPDAYETSDIQAIITLLQQKVGQDFSAYKRGTLERRIQRRMGLRGLPAGAISRYHDELTHNEEECRSLAEDLLINVTSFFRDKAVFDLLETEVIPELIGNLAANQALRIWVVGCSTGEEAYSLAMIFRDAIMASRRDIKLQIFASDIDVQAIAVAREGLYPLSIRDEVPADRLARYFIAEENGYRVTSGLRGSVVFTVQDVLNDPPFSRMDMVSCRNLLIYLKPEAQAKVISLFHFALRENGILMLGMAETPGNSNGRFAVVHKAEHIYRHLAQSRPGEAGFPLSIIENLPRLDMLESKQQVTRQTVLANLCRDTVLENFAPASLLINAQRQCVYTVGPVSRYLKVAAGPPSLDVMAMVPTELRGTLRYALSRAQRDHPTVNTHLCETSVDGKPVLFTMYVRFLESDGETLHLVSFIEKPSRPADEPARLSDDTQSQVRELERELETVHAELQKAIQSRDALVLEQKAINDEALSVNEEFQSTNEELLTSKEELQSLNEELIALNSQLQETLDRQRIASDDLQNILYSTNVATLFLDEKLRIRFFTPATKTFFNVIPGDIGRPLSDLQSLTDDADLLADARIVLRDSNTIACEIAGPAGSWFQRRIFPYRTHDDRVEGVVITFFDITERRRTAVALDEARRAAEQSNRGKSRFLAVASHDLRQPLQSLKLVQSMLLQEIAGGRARELVDQFGMLLNTMTEMLNSLLDINQIESGVLEISTSTFPASEMFDRLLAEFQPQAQAKSIRLQVMPTSAILFSDPRLIEVMLRNLLGNAVKFTASGGRILMGCRYVGNDIRIEVWDTGIGIADDQLQAIFDEFHQIDNPARESGRGFGLGLTIVRELGQLLGHDVNVRSWPGKGSVFFVTVPRALRSALAAPKVPDLKALELPEDKPGCNTIALIEDDPGVREALEALLAAAGHTVISAKDGRAALELVGQGAILPDLMITDYNLPGHMDGIEVLSALRARFEEPVPGIVLTGDISQGALSKIEMAECLLLSKPAAAEALHAAIRKLTHATSRQSAASAAVESRVICVIEGNPDKRETLRSVLQHENWSVRIYPDAETFLAEEPTEQERCLFIDGDLPDITGIALIEHLRAKGDEVPAILMIGTGDIATAVQAMRSGANDFIPLPVSRRDLIESIHRAVAQTSASQSQTVRGGDDAGQLAALTPRQKAVLDLVLAGKPSKIIAFELGISQRTVESHRAHIMDRLGVRSIPELVRAALAALPD